MHLTCGQAKHTLHESSLLLPPQYINTQVIAIDSIILKHRNHLSLAESPMGGDKPYPEVPIGNKNHSNAAVVIIGAGISGMCTAIDLVKRNNCRNFVILEKSAGLGGTW